MTDLNVVYSERYRRLNDHSTQTKGTFRDFIGMCEDVLRDHLDGREWLTDDDSGLFPDMMDFTGNFQFGEDQFYATHVELSESGNEASWYITIRMDISAVPEGLLKRPKLARDRVTLATLRSFDMNTAVEVFGILRAFIGS